MPNIPPVDWSSLPSDLVEAIARKMRIYGDYIRFRGVCGAWRSSTLDTPNHLPCQFPWLMLPSSNKVTNHHRHPFFDVADNKIRHLNLSEVSHQPRSFVCGSSHGWLVILHESICIYLLNPLTREKINLPPFLQFAKVNGIAPQYYLRPYPDDNCCFIRKIILSSSPFSGSPFVAVAILRLMDALAYCKRGENDWKYIQEARFFTVDVTYFNGLFYAVNECGKIAVCDLNGDSPVVEFIHTPHLILGTVFPIMYIHQTPERGGDIQYLVNSMGELLLVTRFVEPLLLPDGPEDVLDSYPFKTRQFRLFKLNFALQDWEEVRSLGNMVLFVGNTLSLALLASDFPGCKGNKIYFIDDHYECYCYDANNEYMDVGVGVFNLDDRSFDKLTYCPRNSHRRDVLIDWPAAWITLNPC